MARGNMITQPLSLSLCLSLSFSLSLVRSAEELSSWARGETGPQCAAGGSPSGPSDDPLDPLGFFSLSLALAPSEGEDKGRGRWWVIAWTCLREESPRVSNGAAAGIERERERGWPIWVGSGSSVHGSFVRSCFSNGFFVFVIRVYICGDEEVIVFVELKCRLEIFLLFVSIYNFFFYFLLNFSFLYVQF